VRGSDWWQLAWQLPLVFICAAALGAVLTFGAYLALGWRP
jgi:hypothetical protein